MRRVDVMFGKDDVSLSDRMPLALVRSHNE